jgi:uncharacterized surface protein with fasciclin (FAS1) repeats
VVGERWGVTVPFDREGAAGCAAFEEIRDGVHPNAGVGAKWAATIPTPHKEQPPMIPRSVRLVAGVAVAGLLVAACGDDGDDTVAETVPAATDAAPPATEAPMTTEAPMSTEAPMAATEADIVDTAVAAGDFSTLVTAVQAAGLEETLRGEGPFTVFAPTDDAFAALPDGTLDALLADPSGDLTSILTYHVVAGDVRAADVVGLDGQEVATVNGASFVVNVGDDGSVSLTDGAGNEIGVVATDIETSNGVIHVIDGVLLPG